MSGSELHKNYNPPLPNFISYCPLFLYLQYGLLLVTNKWETLFKYMFRLQIIFRSFFLNIITSSKWGCINFVMSVDITIYHRAFILNMLIWRNDMAPFDFVCTRLKVKVTQPTFVEGM